MSLSLGESVDLVKRIFQRLIEKEIITEIDLNFMKIILKVIYVSVLNLPNGAKSDISTEFAIICLKSLSFYIQRFHLTSKESEKNQKIVRILIKIFVSLNKIFKICPSVLENIEFDCFNDINVYIHKMFFEEINKNPRLITQNLNIQNSDDEHDIKGLLKNFEGEGEFEKIKIKLIYVILDYFFELSKIFNSAIYVINNAIPLETIYYCLVFEQENSEFKSSLNEISIKSFKIFKKLLSYSIKYKDDLQIKQNARNSCRYFYEMVLNIFQKYFLNEFNSILERDENLSHPETESEIISILTKLKSNFENPEFIWKDNLRYELTTKICQVLERINSEVPVEYLKEMKSFQYQSYSNELRIGNIYIKLFNKFPHWILSDSRMFLNDIKEAFIQDDDLDNLAEELNAISNTINYFQGNEDILLNDERYVQKFYSILTENRIDAIEKLDLSRKNSETVLNSVLAKEFIVRKNSISSVGLPTNNLNKFYSDNRITQTNYNSASIMLTKLIPAGLNFLQIISNKSNCLEFILSSSTILLLIKIFDACNTKECLDPILKIIRNINKNMDYIERINLSMFLFLLKKIIFLKETKNKANKDDVNALRIEILKIIKRYIFNEKVGFAIKGLFEFYLPLKIIDSIFSGKEVSEQNLIWIDSELELPDLIWNNDAISQSKKLLEDDIEFILNDEENFENFPQNLFSHKLNPLKTFFFEITDEFRIDNLYLRIFNKDPSYNIRKNLIIFLKHILLCQIDTLKDHAILNFYFDNVNSKVHTRLAELLKQKFVTCLTAICLIIEQINFNDFNDNLAISSSEEMKFVIKDEEERNLINLIQRSFEYQKLLSVAIIKQILSVSKFIFGLEVNLYNSFLHFDSNIRLVYLQIVYLLSLNKNGINLLTDNFDVITIMEKMYNNQDKIGDFEFVVILCIFYRIISNDISHMSCFLTRLFDKYVELSSKRSQLVKYVQLNFCKILNDTHYGESLINSTKNEPIKYRNFSVNLAQKSNFYDSQVSQIWRKAPDSKEQANIIYKINHQSNFVDENVVKSSGAYQNFEGRFPFLPKISATYFNINDINNDEIKTIMENCTCNVKNLDLVNQLKSTLEFVENLKKES